MCLTRNIIGVRIRKTTHVMTYRTGPTTAIDVTCLATLDIGS